MKIRIGWLYPDLMNIYGDRGNIMALVQRCRWRGIPVEVDELGMSARIEEGRHDIFFMGGGQDREQEIVYRDLLDVKGEALKREIENGAAALVICGGYQLFGKFYRPFDGEELKGIEVFDAYTVTGEKRCIGNVVAKSTLGGVSQTIVGFENHSGKTYLGKGCAPLGMVTCGFGNNAEDRTEGAVYLGAIGTYLHGSLLPKNPGITDFLIEKGLARWGRNVQLDPLDDIIELRARDAATSRARKTR
ncbi:MAG: glutamine amidotransferase [Candidatus Anoxymicrobium japonicum]|uniref:Lipid II isoglutaminyl synthase (glutamine-hydrolyzing) subunit GatD n=1 Tax=Candidatus Anoxymicrobium japonicum TaxID=2013648 RepID=A0A2N3G750_9ACTN|nr:MAG: glutamine amidotransferase [Candidatus Anoxymicrobium japonicum]